MRSTHFETDSLVDLLAITVENREERDRHGSIVRASDTVDGVDEREREPLWLMAG